MHRASQAERKNGVVVVHCRGLINCNPDVFNLFKEYFVSLPFTVGRFLLHKGLEESGDGADGGQHREREASDEKCAASASWVLRV